MKLGLMVGFEVLTAVSTKMAVFWFVEPSSGLMVLTWMYALDIVHST
jgi:hypothetical protein